jgi:hypothetical protein
MTFFDQLAADNATFISDFAERIVYTPKGQSPIAINAVVERQPEARIGEASHNLADEIYINVSTADVPTVQKDGDTATVIQRIGNAAKTLTVRNIVSQDQGQWRLKLA